MPLVTSSAVHADRAPMGTGGSNWERPRRKDGFVAAEEAVAPPVARAGTPRLSAAALPRGASSAAAAVAGRAESSTRDGMSSRKSTPKRRQ